MVMTRAERGLLLSMGFTSFRTPYSPELKPDKPLYSGERGLYMIALTAHSPAPMKVEKAQFVTALVSERQSKRVLHHMWNTPKNAMRLGRTVLHTVSYLEHPRNQ